MRASGKGPNRLGCHETSDESAGVTNEEGGSMHEYPELRTDGLASTMASKAGCRPTRRLVTLVAMLAAVAGATASAATSGSERAAGTLALNGTLSLRSNLVLCPPGVTVSVCAERTVVGRIAGLGEVTATYAFFGQVGPPLCSSAGGKAVAYPIRLVVASNGEIDVALAPATECVAELRSGTQPFTVTGATGIYAGAAGTGTVTSIVSEQGVGRQTWTGTLTVPGLEFDVTPPAFAGTTNKTAKAKKGAKSARVTFQVTARDDKDGAVPVTCLPRSGSRFKIGRTRVTCEATDSSANTANSAFTVTVKASR